MSSKKTKLGDFLVGLADGYFELTKIAMRPGRLWYWEYYQSIEQDIENAKLRRQIYQQIYHLERFGYFTEKGFTAKALEKIKKIRHKSDDKKQKPKWDGKWRIVIFDIPERLRVARDHLRFYLKEAGFKMLQNSNWICPYGDFDEIQDFLQEEKIGKYVVLLVSDKISNELLFKRRFNLL